MSLEEGLLEKEPTGGEKALAGRVSDQSEAQWPTFLIEVVTQSRLAAPILTMNVLLYSRAIISLFFLGHLGGLELAGGSLALTMANITGYTFLVGLGTGLDPILGQAYGAKQFMEMGDALQRAVAVLLVCSLPIGLFWLFTEQLLLLLRQDPDIAHLAGKYLRYMLPGLVIVSVWYPLRIYLRSQSITTPLTFAAAIALAAHIPINILCIRTLGWGFIGSAIAAWASEAVFLLVLVAYIVLSGVYKRSWRGLSARVCFQSWGPFLRLAAPACAGTCLEWWCLEVMLLLSGLLENPARSVAAMAICLNIAAFCYTLHSALSSAVSTRVGNELGANCPDAAKLATYVAAAFSLCGGVGLAVTLVLLKDQLAGLFTTDQAVLSLVHLIIPLIALYMLGECPQIALAGVLRGSARPATGAWINLGTYYLVGLPAAVVFAFVLRMGIHGLWVGLIISQGLQAIAVWITVFRTNWALEALKAQDLVKVEQTVNDLATPQLY